MTEMTIPIYYFIDDFFYTIGKKDDAHCKPLRHPTFDHRRFISVPSPVARPYVQVNAL